MAEIKWTVESEKWLKDIYDYIFQDNPNAAIKVVSEIYKKAQILETFPEIGYCYKKVEDGEIRILLYGHYRIAYFIKNIDQVDILGIFHGALDIDKYLF